MTIGMGFTSGSRDPLDIPPLSPARAEEIRELTQLADKLGASLTSAFAKGVTEGRRLDDVLRQMARSIVDIGLKAALKPLQGALSQGLAGLLTNGLSAAPTRGAFPPLPPVRPFAKGGVVAAPSFFPLSGGLGLMGEAGAEAILPLARGADGRLGVRAGAGESRAPTVVVNIHTPDAESFRRSEAQVSAAIARAVSRGRRAL